MQEQDQDHYQPQRRGPTTISRATANLQPNLPSSQIADYQTYERKNSHKHVTLMCTDILWDVFCLKKGKNFQDPKHQ